MGYDPTIGVWFQRDPARVGANLYENAAGNPTRYTDPLGLDVLDMSKGPNLDNASSKDLGETYDDLNRRKEDAFKATGGTHNATTAWLWARMVEVGNAMQRKIQKDLLFVSEQKMHELEATGLAGRYISNNPDLETQRAENDAMKDFVGVITTMGSETVRLVYKYVRGTPDAGCSMAPPSPSGFALVYVSTTDEKSPFIAAHATENLRKEAFPYNSIISIARNNEILTTLNMVTTVQHMLPVISTASYLQEGEWADASVSGLGDLAFLASLGTGWVAIPTKAALSGCHTQRCCSVGGVGMGNPKLSDHSAHATQCLGLRRDAKRVLHNKPHVVMWAHQSMYSGKNFAYRAQGTPPIRDSRLAIRDFLEFSRPFAANNAAQDRALLTLPDASFPLKPQTSSFPL